MAGTFGGRGKRPSKPTGSGEQGEIYIKSFKDDRTLIWILDTNPPVLDDGSPGYFNIEQHYDPNVKRSWPCAIAEGATHCVGCEFPIEDPTNENDRGLGIRKTSSQYIFPVVGEAGYVELYQFGYGLWKALCDMYAELGSITDAWISVRRTKQGQKISITATKTDNRQKPEVKIDVPTDEYIAHAVGKRYLEAVERYGYDPEGNAEGGHAADAGDDAQASSNGEVKGSDDPWAKPEPSDASSEPGVDASDWNPSLNAREASMGELKDWLAGIPTGGKFGGPREFPSRAGRPVLVGLVEKAQAEFAPF